MAKPETEESGVPQPGTISKEKLCEWTRLSDRRLRQIADEGYFPPPARGRYRQDAIPGMFRYLFEQLHRRDDSQAIEDLKLTTAKRETAEEQLAILRKEYVRKEEIGPALRNLSLHQRALLQRKLENELAPNLAGRKTAEILVLVKAIVDELCEVFREGTRAWMESAPSGPGEPASKADTVNLNSIGGAPP